jgi:hypothetical protein
MADGKRGGIATSQVVQRLDHAQHDTDRGRRRQEQLELAPDHEDDSADVEIRADGEVDRLDAEGERNGKVDRLARSIAAIPGYPGERLW